MRIHEIFSTLEGEGPFAGYPTVFIRTAFCPVRCAVCFPANARVTTSTKCKNIDQIVVGDKILSYQDGKIVETVVSNIMKRQVHYSELVQIVFNKWGEKCTDSSGCCVFVTKEHPFFVDGKWVAAQDLKIGDEIYYLDAKISQSFRMSGARNARFRASLEGLERMREAASRIGKNYKMSKKAKAELSHRMKSNNPMKNPEVAYRAYLARTKSPNGSESRIIRLINKANLPIKFVGDGSIHIGYKSPDFLVEGQKKVIETYDSSFHYHGRTRDAAWVRKRTAHFAKYGYECLCFDVFHKKEQDIISAFTNFSLNGKKVLEINPVTRLKVKSMKGYNKETGMIDVYNVEAKDTHCYFANNLLVHNCDTGFKDADFISFKTQSVKEIADEVSLNYPRIKHVCVTGGEPLLEPEFADLIEELTWLGKKVHVETSGVTSFKKYLERDLNASFVVDIKTPSLKCRGQNMTVDWCWLRKRDCLKAVISDRTDYEYVRDLLQFHTLDCPVFLSPVHDGKGFPVARQLAEWILKDGLDVRLQLQTHKILDIA